MYVQNNVVNVPSTLRLIVSVSAISIYFMLVVLSAYARSSLCLPITVTTRVIGFSAYTSVQKEEMCFFIIRI